MTLHGHIIITWIHSLYEGSLPVHSAGLDKCIKMCPQLHCYPEPLHCSKNPLWSPVHPFTLHSPDSHWCSYFFPSFNSPKSHIVGIRMCRFSAWFLSLSNIPSRFFHVFIAHFISLLNNIPAYGWTTTFIHSPTKGYLSFFQALTIMNEAWVTSVCRFLCGHKFSTHLGKYHKV